MPGILNTLGKGDLVLPYTDFCLEVGGNFCLAHRKISLENGLVVCKRNL